MREIVLQSSQEMYYFDVVLLYNGKQLTYKDTLQKLNINDGADPFTSNQKKYPCVIDTDRLVQLINRSIQAIGAMFAIQTVRYIPPNNRNVLIS